jgi:hypothetical protein
MSTVGRLALYAEFEAIDAYFFSGCVCFFKSKVIKTAVYGVLCS